MKKSLFTTTLFLVVLVSVIGGCGESKELNAVLDDLESTTDRLVVLVEREKAGDADAVSESEELVRKYFSSREKFLEASSDWSEAQRVRFVRIENKYQEEYLNKIFK